MLERGKRGRVLERAGERPFEIFRNAEHFQLCAEE